MPLVDRTTFESAIRNIAKWGDTDIFPFPVDNHIMHDSTDEVASALLDMGAAFKTNIDTMPIISHSTLAPVGYTGFRWATQIDPLWNAYLLGLVLSLADEIEAVRIPRDQNVVYSYRYEPDSERLFWSEGWLEFQNRSRELAGEYPYAVVTDIADFYPRIYHHPLQNALQAVDRSGEKRGQIMDILIRLSNSASYGLPVGGPAARLLSELAINQIDRLIDAERGSSQFCRYADDYRLFVKDVPTAYQMIGSLSDKLLTNQGLSLQKSKTAIMTSEEYLAILDPIDPPEGSAAKFLSLHLHFDPYSETPVEDYERLRDQMAQFDILDLLRRELLKGQVHASVTRKLVKALRFLDEESRELAIRSLLDDGNFERLAPVMPHVMMAIQNSLAGLDEAFLALVAADIRRKIESGHYLTRVELNLAYMIRVLAMHKCPESERLLIPLYGRPHGYRNSPSPAIQRDIMLILSRWGTQFWLSDQKGRYQSLHPWVRRAFSIGSYAMGDEGKHWRRATKPGMSAYDRVVLEWASKKAQLTGWQIPL